MRLSLFRAAAVAAIALGLSTARATAQVGSTTDIVTGKVTGTNGQPIEGATVTAQSVETRVSRSRTTAKDGRYTILFPDGGGQYRLTVKSIGVAPQTQVVTRQGDEDRLVHDFKMSVNAAAQTLAQVTVNARRPTQTQERPTPGGTERNFSADQMSRLPVDANDLNNLAAITAGVVSASGTDTSSASFNVAGQRATQNNLTLDGISFGSSSVPQEAVRGTRVITSTYDVARGQFTGGQIASTTRSGTNILQGSATMNWRDPSLQWTPGVQGAFGQGYNQNTISAGLGGPIIEDQLFFFGALQYRTQLNPIQTITSADSISLVRLGLDSATVAQFLNRVTALGLSATSNGIPGRRTNDNLTGIVRVDYNIFEDHTLTLRGDYRFTQQDGSRIGSYSTLNHGGNAQSTGSGLQATLTSRMGSFIHEIKGYYSTDNRDGDPYVDYPEGRVRVSTLLPDGTNSVTSLTFGANPGLPNAAINKAFEGTDELSWISPGGEHRVKAGLLYNWQSYDQTTGFNQYGSYTYNTLADFIGGATPASYARTLGVGSSVGSAVNAALYLGDVWRVNRAWQFTYGIRGENSRFSGTPAYNAAADAAFGLRTDRFASETHISPRVGFTWTIFGAENNPAPVWFVRGGVGEFRGRAPTNLYTSAQQGSGLAGTATQLTCIGSGVPAPTWSSFDTDPSTIPSACAAGAPPAFSSTAPQVTAFANDFQAPRTWRTSLSVTRRFWERWTASVDAQYAWGETLYGVVDRNLNTTPQFALANEGNRPVYVPAASIVPINGFTSVSASRQNAAFAQVYEIGSALKSTTGQVTATVGGFTDKGIIFNLSYTYQNVRDQSSWSFGPPLLGFSQATTADNPNVLAWAQSDLERKHNIIGTVTWPLNPSLELTLITRVTSGGHYSPLVGSDINGDGARNDRAFIFDPATPGLDTSVANGMTRLLSKTSGGARACLLAQMGQTAGRNTCDEPWFPSVDLQVNWRPDTWGLQRRLALSLSFVNPLTGLDQLINGERNLKGWGQQQRSDNTLLYVRGFDAGTNRYKYEVNERFGNTVSGAQAFRQPFLLQLQARFTYGQNVAQERFGGFGGFGGGGGPGGGGGAGGGTGGAFGALANRITNPLAQLIEMKDSLKLDSLQVTKLSLLSDTLAAQNKRLGDEVRAAVAKAGNNPDPTIVFAAIRPKLDEGRKNFTEALKQSQAILTAEQWKLVPANIKNPFSGFGQDGNRQQRPAGNGGQRP